MVSIAGWWGEDYASEESMKLKVIILSKILGLLLVCDLQMHIPNKTRILKNLIEKQGLESRVC